MNSHVSLEMRVEHYLPSTVCFLQKSVCVCVCVCMYVCMCVCSYLRSFISSGVESRVKQN